MDFETILIYTAIQSSLIFVILLFRKFRNTSNLFFGGIIAAMVLHHLYYLLWHRGYFESNEMLVHIVKIFSLFAPIIGWHHAYAFITGSIVVNRKTLLHFIPLTISILTFIPLVYFHFSFHQPYLDYAVKYNLIYGEVIYFVTGILFIGYGFDIICLSNKICGRKLGFFRNTIDFSSNRLIFAKVFAFILFIYGIGTVVQSIMMVFELPVDIFYYMETAIVIFLAYWILFVLVYNPKIIHFKMASIKADGKLMGYDNSGLNDKEAVIYMRTLNNWMEAEKPFKNSNLSLADLAEKLELPGYTISEILNRLLKQNFYEYVNNYRIEEFKRLLLEPKYENIKFLNIAFDVGFNSKSTFNTSFKKFTGKTPSEFKKSLS